MTRTGREQFILLGDGYVFVRGPDALMLCETRDGFLHCRDAIRWYLARVDPRLVRLNAVRKADELDTPV